MFDAAKKFDDIAFHDDEAAQDGFRAAMLDGLSRTPKSIPCQFLYDATGSALFDKICETPEYYVTRVETKILQDNAAAIAALAGPECQVFELGSGSSRKIRILLDALPRPAGYVAIDISRDHLRMSATALKRKYPWLAVTALCADYNDPPTLPSISAKGKKLGFFPGSTIGNLRPDEAKRLLRQWADRLGPGSAMLIGVDRRKDPKIVDAAYNDAAGVTAAFTKNLLVRANRELGTNFVAARFAHRAHYDPGPGRVEIHLESLESQKIRLADRNFQFAAGERIHIEYSYKYAPEAFTALAAAAGFATRAVWTDPAELFALYFLAVA